MIKRKLALIDAQSIRNKYYQDTVSISELAEEYGVSDTTISRIVNNKTYRTPNSLGDPLINVALKIYEELEKLRKAVEAVADKTVRPQEYRVLTHSGRKTHPCQIRNRSS